MTQIPKLSACTFPSLMTIESHHEKISFLNMLKTVNAQLISAFVCYMDSKMHLFLYNSKILRL